MKVKTILLAGGRGTRLAPLTLKRAKPAVPFAAKYRVIDFTLSNCVNSGLFDILVITQYRPHSLNEHIRNGRPWDLDRGFTGGVHLLHPFQGVRNTDWFSGTADAVLRNINFVRHGSPDLVLVLSGDHVYKMDYGPLIKYHKETGADATLCTTRVPMEHACHYGIVNTDSDQTITGFLEKPKNPPSNVASMGVYIFNYEALERVLSDENIMSIDHLDFGRHLMPYMLEKGYSLYAYPFEGYWIDVGLVDTYWQAHMDLLLEHPPMDLNDRRWVIHTRSEERPATRVLQNAHIHNSLIANGVVISENAVVEDSVLSPGVFVGPGAQIRQSVILNDSVLCAGSRINRCLIDKMVVAGRHAQVGRIEDRNDLGITCVGKNTHLAENLSVGRGAKLGTDLRAEDFNSFGNLIIPDNTSFRVDLSKY